MVTIYGSLGVDKGIHSWKLKLDTDVRWMNIGLIEDDPKVLMGNQYSNRYINDAGGCLNTGGYLYGSTIFSEQTTSSFYVPYEEASALRKVDTELIFTLDKDNNTIQYNINGKDYDIVDVKLDKPKYRLVINFQYKDNAIGLL